MLVMTDVVARDIPAIEHSIESTDPEDYRTVTERYYTKLYCLDEDRARSQDILVLNHSNRICLITLAPSHPVIANKLHIKKVNFEVSKKVDRKSNKTSGKSKKGGQALEHNSILALVETETETFPVKVRFFHPSIIILIFSRRDNLLSSSSYIFRPWFLGS